MHCLRQFQLEGTWKNAEQSSQLMSASEKFPTRSMRVWRLVSGRRSCGGRREARRRDARTTETTRTTRKTAETRREEGREG